MVKIFIFLFLFSYELGAIELVKRRDCPDTDVTDIRPELKQHFSFPRNQGAVGWCYAFAAADLITAEIGTQVSAAQVSSVYNERNQRNPIGRGIIGIMRRITPHNFGEVHEGGFTSTAANNIIQMGEACPESAFPYDRDHPNDMAGMIIVLERAKAALQNNMSGETVCSLMKPHLPSEFTNQDVQEITALLAQQNVNIVMAAIAEKLCRGKMVPVPALKVHRKLRPELGNHLRMRKFLRDMNKVLQKGTPVGVELHMGRVSHFNGMHASVVTAMRWHEGRCQYKIRNSWGPSCANYKPNVNCIQEEGSFWVDNEDLVRSLNTTIHLSR